MEKLVCDNCDREIPKNSLYYVVTTENAPTTFFEKSGDRHFCCLGCIGKYHKQWVN